MDDDLRLLSFIIRRLVLSNFFLMLFSALCVVDLRN